jgi:Ni/Co efflux regulator RcnB
MKTTLLSATALILILSAPAFAAPDDHHGGGGGHGGGHAAPPAHTDVTPPPGGGAMHGTPHDAHADHPGRGDVDRARGNHTPAPPANNAPNGAALFNGGGTHHDRGHHDNTPNNTPNNANPAFNRGGGGQHTGRTHNSAFDSLRRAFNAPRHYHHGTYHRPSGWYAHRWTFGEFLPALFFGNNYWINDYSDFDLSDPPPGTVWVRYGDDALLIDRYSGEVIQVEYGIFY